MWQPLLGAGNSTAQPLLALNWCKQPQLCARRVEDTLQRTGQTMATLWLNKKKQGL
jgi:hypothetical protein